MAVPDTDTFSLQDVVDEINPTTDDLVDCFADANPALFDSNYNNDTYAPANSLKRFRNYGGTVAPTTTTTTTTINCEFSGNIECLDTTTLTSFFIDYGGVYGDANTACILGNSATLREFWHNGLGTYPIIGNTVYQDSGGLYPMSPQNWYYIPGENSAFGIDNSGVVTGKVTCS